MEQGLYLLNNKWRQQQEIKLDIEITKEFKALNTM